MSNSPTVIPVILAGGSGTRLWPLSRKNYPKQLINLFGDSSLLQQTIDRLKGIPGLGKPIIVCNEEHRFTVADQLQEIGVEGQIVLEPVARNTAPAIAVAAHKAHAENTQATLVVLPADHLIKDIANFESSMSTAIDAASAGNLVTFGISPSRPETGYGYIKTQPDETSTAKTVSSFVEKPDAETAQKYLADGSYYWNSGMFVFRAGSFLDELKKLNSECYDAALEALNNAANDLDFIRLNQAAFEKSPNISIDYAVMEKSDNVVCVPLTSDWSDVGCWKSYWESSEKDSDGNTRIGDTITSDTQNSLLFSQDKLIATVGVKDLVIVNTADAVMIAHKDKAQSVKELTDQISALQRDEHINHREVHRPWGSYDSVDNGHRFQVKRIVVKPGAKLSLQMHHHRAEHWIVVKGTAIVQRGEEEIVLSENQSTFIPLGVKHRLTNPGRIPLEIIEVQSGAYLGEDDIVRFEDTYGRQQ